MPVDHAGIGAAAHVQRGSVLDVNDIGKSVAVHGEQGSGSDAYIAQIAAGAEGVVHLQRQLARIHADRAAGGNRIGPLDDQLSGAGFNEAQAGEVGGGGVSVFAGRVFIGKDLVEVEYGIFSDGERQRTAGSGFADNGILVLRIGGSPCKGLVGSQFNGGRRAPAGDVNAAAGRASGFIALGNDDAAGGSGSEFKGVKIVVQLAQGGGVIPELVQFERSSVQRNGGGLEIGCINAVMKQAAIAGIQHGSGGNVDFSVNPVVVTGGDVSFPGENQGARVDVPDAAGRMRSIQGNRSGACLGERGGAGEAGIPDFIGLFRIGGVQNQPGIGKSGGTSVVPSSRARQGKGTSVQRDGRTVVKHSGRRNSASYCDGGIRLELGRISIAPVGGGTIQPPRSGIRPGAVSSIPEVVRRMGRDAGETAGEHAEEQCGNFHVGSNR